jgi:hypothetical protein
LATETINEQVKQYLLGTLSPEEKSRFEEKYFDDDNLFEEIEIVEDELIDAYVREELPPPDRERFKEVVKASPRLTSRVDFARILVKPASAEQPATAGNKRVTYAIPTRKESQPTRDVVPDNESFWRRLLTKPSAPNRFGWAMAACTLLLLLGGGMLLFEWMRLRAETTRLSSERAELEQRNKALASELDKQNSDLAARLAEVQAENDRLAKQLESVPKQTPDSQPKNLSVAFFIAPGGLRGAGGGANRVTISSKTSEVRLQLGLESSDYPSYSATVQTAEGKGVWTRGGLRAQTVSSGKIVELRIPTSQLPNGVYLVEVKGLSSAGIAEPVSNYSFQVVRN